MCRSVEDMSFEKETKKLCESDNSAISPTMRNGDSSERTTVSSALTAHLRKWYKREQLKDVLDELSEEVA